MNNIWFTSDTHFSHKNIVRRLSEWKNRDGSVSAGTRDFDTLEEHDATIVKNINDNVGENDILYHLGDWSFGGIDKIAEFRSQLNCKRIHLIYGNHDHNIKQNDKLQKIFESVQHVKEKKLGGEMMFLSHYPHRVWPNGHKGVIHLYGHCHGSLPDYCKIKYGNHVYTIKDKYKCMDVGLDTDKEFRPYHIDEILHIMNGRILCDVDHHDPKDPN
jgi:calcineurin-like phosphoesterase family protein